MSRNLDLTALRSFAAVADSGGITRAAGLLNLTQSAVSMQIKRLEDALDVTLLNRSGRGVTLTSSGEQLLTYARRMLDINDAAIDRLTAHDYGGEITLGVPHDIIYPHISEILQRFSAAFPRMRVNLVSSYSRSLLDAFSRGQFALILTTEREHRPGAEVLCHKKVHWVGARGGVCWRQRPLRFGSVRQCIFRADAIRALDACAISWEMAVESESDRTIEATVGADLAVALMLEGSEPPYLECIPHNGALPDLPSYSVNLYASDVVHGRAETALADLVRKAFRADDFNPSSQRPFPSTSAV